MSNNKGNGSGGNAENIGAISPEVQKEIDLLFEEATKAHAAGEDAVAQTLYMEILKRKVDHPAAMSNLGDLAKKAGNIDVAQELFRKSVTIKPDFIDGWNS